MNKQEQIATFQKTAQEVKSLLHDKWDEFCAEVERTMESKGDDYAGDDRLSNFKVAGKLVGITPEAQCLSLIATKVARLGQLIGSGKSPNNESVQDSEKDLIVYGFLLRMISQEKWDTIPGKLFFNPEFEPVKGGYRVSTKVIKERYFDIPSGIIMEGYLYDLITEVNPDEPPEYLFYAPAQK